MQLFVWKFGGEERIRTFRMTRLVMGNKLSANLSPEQFPVAYEALIDDSYVAMCSSLPLTSTSSGVA